MVRTSKKKLKVKKSKALKPDEEGDLPPHKYFNLERVIRDTGLNRDKIYNNFKGRYTSLSPEEMKQIATCLMTPISDFFIRLGMRVEFKNIVE